jgi:hypothetical protein
LPKRSLRAYSKRAVNTSQKVRPQPEKLWCE